MPPEFSMTEHEIADYQMLRLMNRARLAAAAPSRFGHSDIGSYLVLYLQGAKTADEVIKFLDVTFPAPPEAG